MMLGPFFPSQLRQPTTYGARSDPTSYLCAVKGSVSAPTSVGYIRAAQVASFMSSFEMFLDFSGISLVYTKRVVFREYGMVPSYNGHM